MFRIFIHSIIALASFWGAAVANADILSLMQDEDVIVCPASMAQTSPPDFTGLNCKSGGMRDVDPQDRLIWVKGIIVLETPNGPNGEPLALFVSGKMSSEFYLNGTYVGNNGTPGADRASEIPGRMDTMLYPPQSLIKAGENEIIFRASSHHGMLKLSQPIHGVGIGVSGNFTDAVLRRYWPSLVTLGLFILGALYFGLSGVLGTRRKRALTFGLICAFAAAQLLSEVLRGLTAYAYPVHDLRLILITVFSAGFGLSVFYHVLSTFAARHVGKTLLGVGLLCALAIAVTKGFDGKAAAAMMVPLSASLVATGIWSYQRRARAFVYFLSLLIFVVALLVFQSLFLDVIFFYIVAAFLLFLFIEQSFVLAREARERRTEEARADRLELALEQARQRDEASQINVKSAGKMERISTDQVVQCRGAGGYSEIIMLDGREFLHSAPLTEMETSLPATFIRVHRSHLVNTSFVKSLTRDASGTGTLVMTDGSEIPVSRRVMPQVRQALA
jgi:hypothetical protein